MPRGKGIYDDENADGPADEPKDDRKDDSDDVDAPDVADTGGEPTA